MRKAPELIRPRRLTLPQRDIVDSNGDQLHAWFREHFKGHPKALTRKECRGMFELVVFEATQP